MYTRLLIPLDGSKAAEQILPYARLLAGTLNLPVTLLTVIDLARLTETMGVPDESLASSVAENAVRQKTEYLKAIAASLPPPAASVLETGKPEEVIIEKAAATQGTLIAMATHGRSGINRWLLGSVAEKVLRATTSPLLLVRGGDSENLEPERALRAIIVPLDGSALAETVLPHVAELAGRLNLDVILAGAHEPPMSSYPGISAFPLPAYDDLRSAIRAKARSYLDGKVQEIKSTGIEKISSIEMEGAAAEKIIELARGTPGSFVAMCTHGRSGLAHWVLGSVTEKVVRHCGHPVLVFPARQAPSAHESIPAPGVWLD